MTTFAPSNLLSKRGLVALAILYVSLTLAFLGGRTIKRVQEARVLETSRQMLDAPDWHGWIVPQVNGETRLRKPPLTYWLTATAFKIGGVNDWAGRVPTLVCGWLCVLVMYFFGRDLLGPRGGFFTAAALASSAFFVRFIRSEETDTPAMLGVIIACFGITKALLPLPYTGEGWGGGAGSGKSLESMQHNDAASALTPAVSRDTGRGSRIWFHFAAVGIALSAMSKGAPAIFSLVFIALLCFAFRSRKPFTRFILSGAPITALVLIVPWFAYVLTDSAGGQIGEELKVVTTGSNHFGFFWSYLPTLPQVMVPWTPVLIAALFAKRIRQTPIDAALRLALCLLGCVILPLCVTLNVQAHYLIPTLPGFALLTAWTMTRALEAIENQNIARPTLQKVLDASFTIACWVGFVGGPAILIGAAKFRHGHLVFADIAAGVALFVAGLLLWSLGRRGDASARLTLWAALMVFAMPIVVGWWSSELRDEPGPKTAAAALQIFGDRPLVYWGDVADPALSFYMRRTIPSFDHEQPLQACLAARPDTVVIHKLDKHGTPPLLPDQLVQRFKGPIGDDQLEFLEQKAD